MTRQVFETFDRLTAAKVQTLADQTVMRFADDAARDDALGAGVRQPGMVIWNTDAGQHQYWDGSSWEPFAPAAGRLPVAATGWGDASTTTREARTGVSSPAANTWYEWDATGFAEDRVVWSMLFEGPATATGHYWEIGLGAPGAEVVVHSVTAQTGSTHEHCDIYGVLIPANTRIAIRTTLAGTSLSLQMWTVNVASASVVQSDWIEVGATSTAWKEVAAAPPVADGVWITSWMRDSAANRIGFGASGAEVEVTVENHLRRFILDRENFPVFWPPGTRLALRRTSGTGTAAIRWKEFI